MCVSVCACVRARAFVDCVHEVLWCFWSQMPEGVGMFPQLNSMGNPNALVMGFCSIDADGNLVSGPGPISTGGGSLRGGAAGRRGQHVRHMPEEAPMPMGGQMNCGPEAALWAGCMIPGSGGEMHPLPPAAAAAAAAAAGLRPDLRMMGRPDMQVLLVFVLPEALEEAVGGGEIWGAIGSQTWLLPVHFLD